MLALQESAPGFGEAARTLPWIDQLGLGIVGAFALLGIWRGLWWQVIRLVGVVLAVGLARGLTPRFQPSVEGALAVAPELASGLVWLVLFVAGLVVATLLGMIGKRALEGMQLGLVDRFGGALAGGLTGLMLHAALLVVLSSVGANQGWAARSLEGTRSGYLLTQLTRRPILLDAKAADSIVRPWADSWDEPGTDPRMGPGLDPGLDPGFDPEFDPEFDPGLDPEIVPEIDPGTDSGTEPGAGAATEAGTEKVD